jgi:hypothetical protein
MGFRTVVVLNNDLAHDWGNDPKLGRKIFHAASSFLFSRDERFEYGEIVEQIHADQQTVAFLDGYGGKAIAGTSWYHSQTPEKRNVEMLKALADKLGYRIVKKSTKGM